MNNGRDVYNRTAFSKLLEDGFEVYRSRYWLEDVRVFDVRQNTNEITRAPLPSLPLAAQ